jgi:hypothetical protein
MLRMNWKVVVFALSCLSLTASAQGDQIADLQAQLNAMSAKLARLEAERGDNWLNERRAEEVKSLIMEVLSDANLRASLAGDGMTAGHDGKHFFLQSADGAFALYLKGQIDFRYIWNSQDTSGPAVDEDEGGFQIRRLKLKASGHISSPKFKYEVSLATDRDDGSMSLDGYEISHQINDNLQIAAGLIKLPMLTEELNSSRKLLAVERTPTNEFFTLNQSEGVLLSYDDGPILINFMISDGANSEITDFDEDTSEIALTGRIDYLVHGKRSQGKDFTGWSGEEQFLNIGGAYHLEYGDGRNIGGADYHAHTIDVRWENGPLNLFAAYMGATVDSDEATTADRDMTGFVVQGGVHVVPDKVEFFGQWFTIDGDISGEEEFDGWVAGVNYYINGHRTKFTADVIFLNEMLPSSNPFGASASSSSLGLITGTKDEMAVRTQLQLLF